MQPNDFGDVMYKEPDDCMRQRQLERKVVYLEEILAKQRTELDTLTAYVNKLDSRTASLVRMGGR